MTAAAYTCALSERGVAAEPIAGGERAAPRSESACGECGHRRDRHYIGGGCLRKGCGCLKFDRSESAPNLEPDGSVSASPDGEATKPSPSLPPPDPPSGLNTLGGAA